MASHETSEQAILGEFEAPSQRRRDDVLAFIRALRNQKPAPSVLKRPLTGTELLHSGLVGLWADRSDIGDNHEFAAASGHRLRRGIAQNDPA